MTVKLMFTGPDADHLALAGTLIFDMGQWQIFRAALMIGCEITEGDDEVTKAFEESQ